jgi:hypothetical protein
MIKQNKKVGKTTTESVGVIETQVKHYPRPDYCKCNAGHTLVEVFNENRNCYDWDCPICIAKMQKARGVN